MINLEQKNDFTADTKMTPTVFNQIGNNINALAEEINKQHTEQGTFEQGKNYNKNDVFDYGNGKYLVDSPFIADTTPDFSKVYIISQKSYDQFTMEIDATINANPSVQNGGIKYSGGCENFSQDDWVTWLGYSPCVMYGQGVIECYLDPNNYEKNKNGNDVDIVTPNTANKKTRNVMVEYKRIGLQSIQTAYGKWVIRCTNDPCDNRYRYSAFSNGKRQGKTLFIGVYNGSVPDSKLHSVSNATITSSGSLNSFRILAQANGINYNLLDIQKLSFLKHLFMLQNSTINGVLMNRYDTSSLKTGFLNTTGLNKKDSTTQCGKILGIETNGFSEVIDGVFVDANLRLKISENDNYNNDGSSYTDCGRMYAIGTGYIGKSASLSPEYGVIANDYSGTSTTGFHCPTAAVQNSTIMNINMTNLFNYEFKSAATTTLNGSTARLCYLDT